MDMRRIALLAGFAILLIGIVIAFVYFFRDQQEQSEYQQQVREERVHNFLTREGKRVQTISFNDVEVREHEILAGESGTFYEVTDIISDTSGQTHIAYRTSGSDGEEVVSVADFAGQSLQNVTQRKQIALSGATFDGVAIASGNTFSANGKQYTISGVFARSGQIYVTYVDTAGDAYAVVLSQVATNDDPSAATYETDSGGQLSVSVSEEQQNESLETHVSNIEAEISQLEEELSQAEAAGDTETVSELEAEINQLEEDISVAAETISQIDTTSSDTTTDNAERVDTEATDNTQEVSESETDESSGVSSDDTENSQETDTSTTAQTDEVGNTSEQTQQSTEETQEEDAPISQSGGSLHVDEDDRDTYYNEEEGRWDFDFGNQIIQIIP